MHHNRCIARFEEGVSISGRVSLVSQRVALGKKMFFLLFDSLQIVNISRDIKTKHGTLRPIVLKIQACECKSEE